MIRQSCASDSQKMP